VRPEQRERSSRSALGENEIGIETRLRRYHARKARACLSQPRHWKALCLTCGTSLERIAAESATPPPFVFVHCDIWRRRRCCIPDQVEFETVAACLGRAKRCSARKQDSHESQEPTRCGKWGSMARSRKRAITAFWRSDAAAATAGQSRQIPLRAAIRCRSASASKSGREQPRACRRSAPARLRRRARSPDT